MTANMFGMALRSQREFSKLSLRDAAEYADVAHATFMRVENGYLPDLENFKKLCQFLRMDGGVALKLIFIPATDAASTLPSQGRGRGRGRGRGK